MPAPQITSIDMKLHHHRLKLGRRVDNFEDFFIVDPLNLIQVNQALDELKSMRYESESGKINHDMRDYQVNKNEVYLRNKDIY